MFSVICIKFKVHIAWSTLITSCTSHRHQYVYVFIKNEILCPIEKITSFPPHLVKVIQGTLGIDSIYNIWYFFQKLFIKWIVPHVHGFSTLNRFYQEMLYIYLTMLSIPSNYESRMTNIFFLFLYFFIEPEIQRYIC